MTVTVISNIRVSGSTNPPPDYTLLSAWESDIPSDLIVADEQWIAECYADWPSGLDDGTTISANHNPDATRNIIIRSATGQGHNGVFGDGFILYETGFGASTLVTEAPYTLVQNISIKASPSGSSTKGVILNGANCSIDRCIISRVGSTSGMLLTTGSNTTGRTVLNSLFIGGDESVESFTQLDLYGNVFVDSKVGFRDTSANYDKVLRNNISFNNSTSGFILTTGSDSDYNASEDTTATGANSITGITASEFINAAGYDYHLEETSQLRGAGLNLIENTPNLDSPQYDIDGDKWPDVGVWDIGVDYYVAAGGGTTPIGNNTTLQWNLLETISQSNSILWNLLESISNNSELQWNIIQAVSNSSELRWDLLASLSAVSNTSGFYWDIIEAVSSSSDLKWSLLESVNNTSSLHWDLLSALASVSNTSEFKWSMAGSVSQLLDTKWDLLEQVGVTQELRWTLTEAISQSLESKWNLLQSANNNIQIQWNSISAVDGIVELRWSLLSDTVTLTTTNILILRAKNKNLNLRAKEKTLTLRT